MNWRSFLSDNNQQDSKTAYNNTRKLIIYLRDVHKLLPKMANGGVSVLYIRSDGCAAHYRSANCCMMNQLLSFEFGIQIDWMIMCPHHGKSPCDCLGGVDKHDLMNGFIKGMSNADMTNWLAMSEAEKGQAFMRRDRWYIGNSKHVPHCGHTTLLDRREYKISNETPQ